MPNDELPVSVEAELREHLDALARAIRARDVDALLEDYRRNFEAWFASMRDGHARDR